MKSLCAAALLAVAACATAPPPEPPAPAPAPVAQAEALVCPPAPQPVCPTPATPVTPTPPPIDFRGRLLPGSWVDLPNWGSESLRPSLVAFTRGCPVLEKQDAWKAACAGAATMQGAGEREIASFFEMNFDPWQVVNADDSTSGMVTGYYEPLLHGSRARSKRFRYPLYAVPDDLLVIDLTDLYPEFKHKRLRGKLVGNRVVPYYSRSDIEKEGSPLHGKELVWVDDAVDAFFLHIQGSGQVEMENGERMRVGYADQNGHPFRSLGRLLIDRGEIPPERASMQGIKDWARHHPKKVQEFLNANPSYVFFRELPKDLPGPIGALGVPLTPERSIAVDPPIGALGVPLTPERSIAVDPRVIPLGVPVYLATTWPNTADPLERLMVAQDTGGAINGGVRADFFWGFGDPAGSQAGKMRQAGRMWVLLPKGYTPNPPAPAKLP